MLTVADGAVILHVAVFEPDSDLNPLGADRSSTTDHSNGQKKEALATQHGVLWALALRRADQSHRAGSS